MELPQNPNKYAYQVTIEIDRDIEEEWASYMFEPTGVPGNTGSYGHMFDVLEAGKFIDVDFERANLIPEFNDASGANDKPTSRFKITYYARSKEDIQQYLDNHADKFKADHSARFEGKFSASREIFEYVNILRGGEVFKAHTARRNAENAHSTEHFDIDFAAVEHAQDWLRMNGYGQFHEEGHEKHVDLNIAYQIAQKHFSDIKDYGDRNKKLGQFPDLDIKEVIEQARIDEAARVKAFEENLRGGGAYNAAAVAAPEVP